jgi:hypothetical protein
MIQDPPPATCTDEIPTTKSYLEIDCTDSSFFMNVPLDGLISLQSLRFQSTSRCQEIYDSQENYIGTCTRISNISSAEETDDVTHEEEDIDWITTQLNLDDEDDRVLVSGHLAVKVLLHNAYDQLRIY